MIWISKVIVCQEEHQSLIERVARLEQSVEELRKHQALNRKITSRAGKQLVKSIRGDPLGRPFLCACMPGGLTARAVRFPRWLARPLSRCRSMVYRLAIYLQSRNSTWPRLEWSSRLWMQQAATIKPENKMIEIKEGAMIISLHLKISRGSRSLLN